MATEERDYFTDHSVLTDPYAYFEELRAKGPVHTMQTRPDVVFVTGFDESLEVLRNTQDFSSIVAPPGAAIPLPFTPTGDDISEQLEQHRHQIPGSDLLVSYDGAKHSASRSILNRLFVPSRLKANEAYMRQFGDQLVRDAVAKGGCELIRDIAVPFVTLVIADLLGVPADDRETFMEVLAAGPPAGNMDAQDAPHSGSILEYLAGYFVRYIQERRDHPRGDVMSDLATAKLPDGSTPDLMEVVRLAVFLFAAGQDTSAKLIGNSMRFITEDQGLQQQLRADPTLVPAFIEEVLRLEGSTKGTFRVARRRTRVGGQEIAAGQKLVVGLAAANRDPRRWPNPTQFRLDREKAKEHLAFGRGAHTCAGAPLARTEVRVIFELFLQHTSRITLSEAHHGSAADRKLDYEPSFIIRGLEKLFVEFKPA